MANLGLFVDSIGNQYQCTFGSKNNLGYNFDNPTSKDPIGGKLLLIEDGKVNKYNAVLVNMNNTNIILKYNKENDNE